MKNHEAATVAQQLSQRITALSYEDIPDKVLSHTRRLLMDTIGVAWAGAAAPGSAEIEDLMVSGCRQGNGRVWTSGNSLDPMGAAFVNSVHAAALDYDSVLESGSVHPDIVNLPAVWAMSEAMQTTGRSLMTALVIANETMCRLATSTRHSRGWFNTALYGGFSAAAGASKIIGLDVRQTCDALGLALCQTAGTQQALIERTAAKRVQSGFAARAGVFAALLARTGITAPAQCFEGEFGLYRMYSDGDVNHLFDGFGEDYLCCGTAVKKYPSCTANHVPVDCVLHIVDEHNLAADDIKAIKVVISPFAHGLVGAPFDPSENPQVAAQFSLEYSIACAAVRRRLKVTEIEADAVLSPEIRRFINRVSIEVDGSNCGKFAPAEVIVETARHGTLRGRLENVPGTPEYPLTSKQIEDKFRACVSNGAPALNEVGVSSLIKRLARIDEAPNMAKFLRTDQGKHGMGKHTT